MTLGLVVQNLVRLTQLLETPGAASRAEGP